MYTLQEEQRRGGSYAKSDYDYLPFVNVFYGCRFFHLLFLSFVGSYFPSFYVRSLVFTFTRRGASCCYRFLEYRLAGGKDDSGSGSNGG